MVGKSFRRQVGKRGRIDEPRVPRRMITPPTTVLPDMQQMFVEGGEFVNMANRLSKCCRIASKHHPAWNWIVYKPEPIVSNDAKTVTIPASVGRWPVLRRTRFEAQLRLATYGLVDIQQLTNYRMVISGGAVSGALYDTYCGFKDAVISYLVYVRLAGNLALADYICAYAEVDGCNVRTEDMLSHREKKSMAPDVDIYVQPDELIPAIDHVLSNVKKSMAQRTAELQERNGYKPAKWPGHHTEELSGLWSTNPHSGKVITFYFAIHHVAVQFMVEQNRNIPETLDQQYDLDCCCYYATRKGLLTSQRGLRAMWSSVNTVRNKEEREAQESSVIADYVGGATAELPPHVSMRLIERATKYAARGYSTTMDAETYQLAIQNYNVESSWIWPRLTQARTIMQLASLMTRTYSLSIAETIVEAAGGPIMKEVAKPDDEVVYLRGGIDALVARYELKPLLLVGSLPLNSK